MQTEPDLLCTTVVHDRCASTVVRPFVKQVIKNNKDFFDQSLDEIKLLQRLSKHGNPDDHHVLRLLDHFYYKVLQYHYSM
jgi:serine/threonine protein kinase